MDLFITNTAYVTLYHKTKPVISNTGIFVAIAAIHFMGQKYRFLFYAKIIILSKDSVPLQFFCKYPSVHI